MSNPLYNAMNGNNTNTMGGFFNALNNLKRTFTGNPEEQIQRLLNSGKVSQEQYNQAVKTAQNIQKMMNTKP